MNRRSFIAASLAAPLIGAGASAGASSASALALTSDHPLQASWAAWKALCLSPEGRVIDGFQGNSSHSEGQGYGLALATAFGDAAAADLIIHWTETSLARQEEGLLSWRWRPEASPHVTDRNNASDGDLFYAWGLVRAAGLGEAEPRLERAGAICRALLRYCTAPHPDGSGRPVLLPGIAGFRRSEGIVINPSYTMGLALRDLARACQMPELHRLADSGEALVAELADRGPVPDWVLLTATGLMEAPAPFSGVSGYEAVRVPLFALWSGQPQNPSVQRYAALMKAAGQNGGTPTVFNPAGGSVFERSSHAGYAAVAALAACAVADEVGSLMPVFNTDQPYYPATLHLMALVIQVTTYPKCVPI